MPCNAIPKNSGTAANSSALAIMTSGWFLIAAQGAALAGAPQAAATRDIQCRAPAAECDSIAPAPSLRRSGLSWSGLPGLIRVPAAATIPTGAADLSFDGGYTPSVIPGAFFQRNAFIAFGFLPRLTISGRGTVADTGGPTEVRDLSANAQFVLLKERRRMPAIAAGIQDVGQGAVPYFPSRFVVASKTFLGHARVSAGYASGKRLLDGPFGGVELELGQWVTALGEYDGEHYNGGVRVFPFPSFADRIGLQPALNVAWTQGMRPAMGISARTWLGGIRAAGASAARIRRPAGAAVRAPAERARSAATQADRVSAPGTAPLAIEQRLNGFGFENVRVGVEPGAPGATMAVEYENRRFNHDELDALGIVMGVTATAAADSVTRMRVTIRRVDVPVMAVESGVAAFIAFVNGGITDESFADQLVITHAGPERPVAATAGVRVNASRFKLDLVLRPHVETTLLTDLGIFDSRVSLRPNAVMQLGPGLVLNAQRTIAVSETRRYPGQLDDPNADRLLVHKALRVPPGRVWGADAITQFSIGRFGHERVGFAHELDLSVAGGLVSLGSAVAVFGRTFGDLDHTTALATLRVRRPEWDLTTSLTAGRFLNGDSGALADLSRFFGATELGFYVRATDRASVAGVRIGLPLAPARELAPVRIRPRLPAVHDQAIQSVILDPIPVLRRDVGLRLATDHDVGLVYRIRDRLQPATVRVRVAVMRDAVRRWLAPATFPDRTFPER